MTGTELNRQIEISGQQRAELLPPAPRRKTGRAYRRMMKTRKFERLYRIVTSSYVPHAGYVDWSFVAGRHIPTGTYIKYPRNSNCQRWIKRETSVRQRRCSDLPHKGNAYRRLFDYWWTLY